MPSILVYNPRKKATKTRSKSKGKSMATKRKRNKDGRFAKTAKRKTGTKVKTRTKTKTIVKYRNPAKPTKKKRAYNYARRTIGGVNIGGAARSFVPLFLGGLAALFTAKKFGDSGGATQDWTWKEYLLGPVGGFIAAFIASALFKARGNTAQKLFEGALVYTGMQFFRNEVITTNDTMEEWFGTDNMPLYDGVRESEFDMLGETDAEPGDLWDHGDGNYEVMGADGRWRPTDDMDRVGDDVEPFNPTMGDDVEPFNPTMGGVMEKYVGAYGLQ